MRIVILLLSTIVLLTSCNKGSDSAAATTDPVFGSWSYIAPGATATVFTGYAGILKEDGNVTDERIANGLWLLIIIFMIDLKISIKLLNFQ